MSNFTLAQELVEQAIALREQDQKAEAVSFYLKAITAAPEWATPHYNLGLYYKYESNWQLSYQHNKKATELNTESEAAWWNLGIAATVLEDWHTARTAWTQFGLKLEVNDEEPAMALRNIPIRLNPDDAGEVVWCKRIDPARAIILSIPLATSGHRFGDMILNDGAPMGTRISDGEEYSVLNELKLLKPSEYKTYSVTVYTSTQSDIDKLEELCEVAEIEMEDWSTIRYLCKQCSEGIAHKDHDQDNEERETPSERYIGFASFNELRLMQVLTDWSVITLCEYSEVVLELE